MTPDATQEHDFQAELSRLLRLSTLTPSTYVPSAAIKSVVLAAVFVGDDAAILCGPADDPESVAQADALATSNFVQALFHAAHRSRQLRSGVVAGALVSWQATDFVASDRDGNPVKAHRSARAWWRRAADVHRAGRSDATDSHRALHQHRVGADSGLGRATA